MRAVLVGFSVLTAPASAALSWLKAGTGSSAICAAAYDPCSGYEQCTKIGLGSCAGGVTTPTAYLTSNMVGLAFVDGEDTSNNASVTEIELANVTNNGYRQINETVTVGSGNTYAFVRTGAFVGSNPQTSGGYVGSAWYVLKTGTISTNTNSFVVGNYGLTTTSDYDICIAEWTNSACGSETTYTPGDVKFSIFGYSMGSSYSIPGTVDYLGFRTKLTASGDSSFNANTSVQFNSRTKTLTNIGTTDVTQMEVTLGSQTVSIAFPLKYNVGSISGNTPTVTATKTVKVKAAAVSGDSNSFYLDYLFAASDFQAANKFFVYDPTVSSGSGTTTPPPGRISHSHRSSKPAMLAFALILSCFGFYLDG